MNSERQAFIVIHRGKIGESDTYIQVYNYALEEDEPEPGKNISLSFHGHRTQEFNLPIGLDKPYLFYSDASGELTLDICRNKVQNDFENVCCKNFEWTGIGTDVGDFVSLLEPSMIDKWLSTASKTATTDLGRFKLDQDVVFVQKVVRNKQDREDSSGALLIYRSAPLCLRFF